MLQYYSPESEVMDIDTFTILPASDGGMGEGGEV